MKLISVIVAPSNRHELDRLLADGWRPVSVTAQHCATSIGDPFGYRDVYGGWLVILEKPE